MTTKIAINGFGRIGRCVGRILNRKSDIELVAVNDLADGEQLAYLFDYDTVHGAFDGDVEYKGDELVIDGESVKLFSEKDPSSLPWEQLDIDFTFECTGQFRRREDAQEHIDAGSDHVLISAPGKGDIDYSVVMGVNHEGLDPSMEVIDVASCTTNCLAPVAKVLNDEFGINSGLMTTIHSYTNSQSLLDGPNKKDFRRGRTAAANMVPTSTGAAVAVTRVIPELEGKLDGMAVRVPTPNVSMIDLVAELDKPADIDSVNGALKEASKSHLEGILGVTEDPVVSTDMLDDPHSSVADLEATMAVGEGTVKVISWYDNEWGFANRMVDVAEYIKAKR